MSSSTPASKSQDLQGGKREGKKERKEKKKKREREKK
jgi:hypothetical protein